MLRYQEYELFHHWPVTSISCLSLHIVFFFLTSLPFLPISFPRSLSVLLLDFYSAICSLQAYLAHSHTPTGCLTALDYLTTFTFTNFLSWHYNTPDYVGVAQFQIDAAVQYNITIALSSIPGNVWCVLWSAEYGGGEANKAVNVLSKWPVTCRRVAAAVCRLPILIVATCQTSKVVLTRASFEAAITYQRFKGCSSVCAGFCWRATLSASRAHHTANWQTSQHFAG